MSIYLRHGTKAYDNNAPLPLSLDAPLTQAGQADVRNRAETILQSYHPPKCIYCSPLLRTRMTASIIQSAIIDRHDILVPVIIESTLSEYLGNQRHKDVKSEVYPETWHSGIVLPERWPQFQKRIDTHLQKYNPLENNWFITHGLFIKEFSKKMGVTIDYPDQFTGIYIDAHTINIL